jgi:hypothetical protein
MNSSAPQPDPATGSRSASKASLLPPSLPEAQSNVHRVGRLTSIGKPPGKLQV